VGVSRCKVCGQDTFAVDGVHESCKIEPAEPIEPEPTLFGEKILDCD